MREQEIPSDLKFHGRISCFNSFGQIYWLSFLAAFLAELKHEPSSPKPRTLLKGEEKENSLIMTQTKKNPNLFSLNQVTIFSRH